MFQNCSFFFKAELVKSSDINEDRSSEEHSTDLAEIGSGLDSPSLIETDTENENLQDTIIQKLASVLLKLEIYSHVPSSTVDEFLEELHFIFTSAVVPISNSIAIDIFKKHDLHVDQLIINELSLAISTHSALAKAIAKDLPLASAFKRQQYYKDHFKVVEPFEYVLDARSNKTIWYVPLLKSLLQLFSRNDVVDKAIDSRTACSVNQQQYLSFHDGVLQEQSVSFR